MLWRFNTCLESAGKIAVEEVFLFDKMNTGNLLGLKAGTEFGLPQASNCPKLVIKRVAVSGNVI